MKIKNLEIYNKRMKDGMDDKLFFLNEITNEKTVFVDFGCADGTILEIILEIFPNVIGIGIDSNKDMLNLSYKKCLKFNKNKNRVFFCESLEKCLLKINNSKDLKDAFKIINFSSVMHEIYHYCNQYEKDKILNLAFSGTFDKIFIRDMSFKNKNDNIYTNPYEISCLYNNKQYYSLIFDFEKYFGKIYKYKNFIHFLMKYKYIENWDRECGENYFFNFEDMKNKLNNNYIFEVYEYTLPYLYNMWKNELNIEVNAYTHFKLIARKEIKK